MPKNLNQSKKIPQKEIISDDDDDGLTLPVSDESESDTDQFINEEVMPIPEEIIYPGLVFKSDYILLKKIGYGNNAGVWMIYQISTKSYSAMKIQDYQCFNDGCREVAIIKTINNYCKANQNKNIYCVNMLDYFVYEEDEETKYVCSVYDLYAGSIHMVINNGKHKYGLPISVVKKITKQLLLALVTLHGELKIIHTDIKPENILFKGMPDYQLKIMDMFTKSGFQQKYDDIYARFSKNNTRFSEELEILAMDSIKDICSIETNIDTNEEFIPDDEDNDEDDLIEGEDDDYSEEEESESESEDGGNDNGEDNTLNVFNERKQSIDDIIENIDYTDIHNLEKEVGYDFTTILNNRADTTDKREMIDDKYVFNCETALTDFGNSYFFDKRTRNEIQDRRYRAPEVVLDFNYGYACDIWSLACVVFELLTGFTLFEPEDKPLNKDIHHLFMMEKSLGSIPLRMKKSSRRNKFLFDKKRNYHVKNIEPFVQTPLKQRLVQQFLFDEKDASEIYDFIVCGLKYEPAERSTASEMLNHPWLK